MENLADIMRRLRATRKVSFDDMAAADHSTGNGGGGGCEKCGGSGWFTVDVPVGDPSSSRIIPCECQHERIERERLDRLRRYSNVGELSRFTFETLRPEGLPERPQDRETFRTAYERAREYSDRPKGWLVVTGAHGSGKTHLAAAIANRCIEAGRAVFFVHVPDLLDHLRAGFSPDAGISYDNLYEQVVGAPILVLDGLGAHSSTPWAQEKLQQVINHRYNAERPTVITTAMSLNEIDPYIRTRLSTPDLSTVVSLSVDEPEAGLGLGGVNPVMARRMTFDSFDVRGNNPTAQQRASLEGAFESARNYAADPHGWLTLFGETGAGKTHLAVAIAVERIARGQPVRFAFVPELMDYLRYTFTPESTVTYDRAFEEIKNADLLILDDLGQEHSSPWAGEKMYQIIVHRHNGRLPTVITSPLDIAARTGPICSRIRDPYVGQLVRVYAPDHRIRERVVRRAERRLD